MNEFITMIFLLCSLIAIWLFGRTLFAWLFGMENYSIHKKRMEQLNFKKNENSKRQEETKNFINKLTNPVQEYVLPKVKSKKTKNQLQRELKLIGWDDKFTPTTYRAFNILLKMISPCILILLYPFLGIMAVIWCLVLFFALDFFFSNTVSSKKEKLFKEFPDFIRITQAYLSADIPLAECVEKCIPFIGEDWKPILQRFSVTCRIDSIETALEKLKEEVDIFEVRELVGLIKLNLEQGIEINETFDRQADKVRDLQLESIYKQINKRQTMAILVQGPLLLTMLFAFGLPTFESMLNLGGL